MKKTLIILSILALACTSIFASGNNEVKTQEGMTWSNWSGSEEASKEIFKWMIDSFNEDQPVENHVTQINWPWGDTESQLALRAQGSEQYDIAQIDIRMLPALAQAGVLADLSTIFDANYFSDNFAAGSISVGNYNGTQYGIPWTVAPMGMITNTKILKESGVDFDIVTIADFEKAMEMVKNNHPNNIDNDPSNDILPFAAMTKDGGTCAPDFMVWLWTFGASVFDSNGNCVLDSNEAIETIKWFKSLSDKGYIQGAMGRGDARTLFKEGRVAFYNDALLAKGSITNEAFGDIEDYAKPQVNPVLVKGDTPKASGWGHLLVIIDRSPKKAEAKEFIEHLISEDVALKYFDEIGMLPSKKSVLNSSDVKNDYWASSWTPILDGGRLAETAGPNYSAYNSIIVENLQAVLSGSKTAEIAAKDMVSRIENI